ncbi:MAG TPA: hypothetical protein VM118_10485, partial [Acidobacteriota bacterium]|nr:hypothetical protein [Acidobacteriota bacterium]
MHKKPLIAVLIIGLLLLTGNAFAAQDADVFVRVQSPPLDKGALNLVNKGVEPLTAIQGGTPRVVPGTFCTVDWTGGFTGYYYGDMVWAGETYIVYQDVDIHSAGCAGLPNNYTFDVTAVNFIPCNDYPGAAYYLQPVVYGADLTNPACPFPGPLSCAGPIYLFVLPGDLCYGLNMAFSIECCVAGPYFAGFFCPAQDENLGVAIDYTGAVPLQFCHLYNNYLGSPWDDVASWGIVANFLISSEGFTPDDIATHCTPGTCEYQWWYPGVAPGSAEDGWNAGYGLRSTQYGGRDKLGVRFDAIGLDTVKSVGYLLYGPWTTDPAPDMLIEVWDDGGAISNCGYNTPGATPVYSTVVPGASLVFYPANNVTTLPDLTFGTLNGGPIDEFFITITTTQASHDLGLATGLTCYDGGDVGCVPGDMRSLAFYPNYDPPFDDPIGDLGPTWVYIGGRNDAATSAHCEFVMEATICAEKIPIVEADCGPGSTDEWPTFGHDYQNTSASSINVGDPNGIKIEWSMPLGSDMSFCNPTVANDVVYASSSDRLEAFDLATGAPVVGSPFTGIPEMGTSNRANTTIHNGVAYVTGGNFAALSALPVGDLQKSSMLWSNNAMTMGDMSYQNRFGCAMVIDDLGGTGTDVVFVLTEPISNPGMHGELFAFDASDGTLYSGWAPNPLVLDKAARHGPSYDGTYLYVGTGDADVTAGSIWCIDPVTGAPVWQFQDNTIDPANPGGFPGGVSIDGDFLYAVSADANGAGRRFKIDKSAGTAAVVWASAQGSRSLYASPTIGRNFIYVPFDNNAGIGMIDKSIGLQVHNFMLQGVGAITQNVSISCDNILFAGDRDAKWWVLNANTTDYEFYRQYPVPVTGIVNGTALASHSGGDDYAVVGIRFDGSNGRVAAYKLGTGARPRLEQYVWDTEILVPLGATGTDVIAIPDVFENIGDAALTLNA